MAKKTEPQTAEEKAEAKVAEKVNEVAVLNAKGQQVRVYTKELHGDKVVSFAEGYAAKIGGSVKKLA